jgi:hypothetical protein
LIEKADELNFDMLSAVTQLPWSESLIDALNPHWQWGNHGISGNEGITWTTGLIGRYADKLDFFSDFGLAGNAALPWSATLLDQYKDRWNWARLSLNRDLWAKAFQAHVTSQDIDSLLTA